MPSPNVRDACIYLILTMPIFFLVIFILLWHRLTDSTFIVEFLLIDVIHWFVYHSSFLESKYKSDFGWKQTWIVYSDKVSESLYSLQGLGADG